MNISPTNLLESITSGVLFVSSHTTLKSNIPLLPWTSLKNGSTSCTNWALVNASLNSNSVNYEILVIDDGSKDETQSVVENFKSKNKSLHYIKNFEKGLLGEI